MGFLGKDVTHMCAIAGIIGTTADTNTITAMLDTMHRRGPDGSGIWTEADVTLLHGRLAIIDPLGGQQPMKLTWAGETYILVYNGELYNTEELRRDLQGKEIGRASCRERV